MARRSQSYGLQNPLQDVFPAPVVATRAPVTADASRYEIGQMWVDKSANQIYVLSDPTTWSITSPGASDVDTLTGDSGGALSPSGGNINILGGDGLTVAGSGSTLTINRDAAGGYPITPFVVGPSGDAGYTTVQAGINAANAAGGGLVFIQQGTYTEDLTLYDSVFLMGDGILGTTLAGTHTPPTSGSISFWRLKFTDATAILSSAAAGTTTISMESCQFTVTNGFVFDLANWTGSIDAFGVNCNGTNDGVINNTGGASVFLYSGTFGAGSGQAMLGSGTVQIQDSIVNCPIDFQTGSSVIINDTEFNQPLTLSNNSAGTIRSSSIDAGASAAITMSSSGAWEVSQTGLSSSNSPALDGAGAGTLTLEDVSMTGSDDSLAATLTVAYGASYNGTQFATTFDTNVAAAACTLTGTTLAVDGTDANIGFTLSQKGTGAVSIADGTAGAAVTVANGINTVAQTVQIANGACAADSTVSIQSGIATGGTQTLNLGNGAAATAINMGSGVGGNTIGIANGVNTSAQTLNIANGAAAADSTVNIQSGTATGGTQTVNIGNGAAATTVAVADGVGGNTVTIANGVNTVAQSIAIASGDSAGDNTVSVLGGNAASGTQTLNLGTGTGGKTIHVGDGAGVNAVTVGSTNTTSATTINAGSGGITAVGDADFTTGSVSISGAAQGLNVEGGAATDRVGTFTLTMGTATVANTNLTANSRVLVSRTASNSSTALGILEVAISASTNFVATSLDPADGTTTVTGDLSTFHYFIVEQL